MPIILLVELLGAFAGCAPPAPVQPMTPPFLPRIPRTFLEELVVRRKVGGLTLRIFNTGHISTQGGAVSSLKSWEAKVRLDVPVFLIRHPTQGLILFDTGLSSETAAKMNSRWLMGSAAHFEAGPGEDIASQLHMNASASEVRWVVLSTLDLDHTALVDAFAGATVIVSSREWDARKAGQLVKKNRRDFDPAEYENRLKLRLIDFEGAPSFGAFDHAIDLFSDGSVYLIDLAGHSEGSLGAWVNLDAGPVLLAGDAALVVDNYLDLALPSRQAMENPAEYWRKANMLRAMQEAVPRLVILPGHDLTPRTLTDRKDLPLQPFAAEP